MVKTLVALFLVGLLCACGGGGGGSGTTPPPVTPNNAPIASIAAVQPVLAGATVTVDGSASSDPDSNTTLSFAWTLTSKPAGSAATLAAATTAKPTFVADKAGDYVLGLTVNDGKVNSPAASVTVTVLPVDNLQLVINQTGPVSETVRLSLSGSTAGATVSWLINGVQVGTGTTFDWNSASVSNGTYQLKARIQIATSVVHEVQRTVEVKNSPITLATTVSGTQGTIYVDIGVTSPGTVVSVSATFDGVSKGTLTQPNYCAQPACNIANLYRFSVDAAAAGSGDHVMVVTVVNSAGDSRQVSVPVPVSNAPVLAVSSPVDGIIAFGTFSLAGNATSDKSGAVTVTASLGSTQIFSSTTQPFSGSYNLTGVAPGSYVLTINATDATGTTTTRTSTVVVASSAALAYTPVMTLGKTGALLAVEGNLMLHMTEDLNYHLRNTAATTEVLLNRDNVYGNSISDWRVSGGRVYASGNNFWCSNIPAGVCVYQWDSNGTRTEIGGGRYPYALVALNGYVAWCSIGGGHTGGRYYVYDAAKASTSQVPLPAGVSQCRGGYDLSVVGGVANLVFSGEAGSAYEIYRWRADNNLSTPVTTAGLFSLDAHSDDSRVAWLQRQEFNSPTGSLMFQSLIGGGTTIPSTTTETFSLRDGVLAWTEINGTDRRLKVNTAGATTTVSSLNSASVYDNANGVVVFAEEGKVYSWNAARAERTLRIDALPAKILVNGGVMYFVMGDNNTVYKVPLN